MALRTEAAILNEKGINPEIARMRSPVALNYSKHWQTVKLVLKYHRFISS